MRLAMLAATVLAVGLAIGAFMLVQLVLLFVLARDGKLTLVEHAEFFTVFVMLQFWNLFNAKAYMTGESAFKGILKDKMFMAVLLLILVGQVIIVTFGGAMFSVTPLPVGTWLVILLATSPVLLVGEAVRLIQHWRR